MIDTTEYWTLSSKELGQLSLLAMREGDMAAAQVYATLAQATATDDVELALEALGEAEAPNDP